MGLFSRSEDMLRQTVASLQAQLSDRDELILNLVHQAAAERKELLDALLVATRPAVVAELNRPHRQERPPGPPLVNYPGLRRDSRPPVPPLQILHGSGGEPASREEAEEALQKAVDRLNK